MTLADPSTSIIRDTELWHLDAVSQAELIRHGRASSRECVESSIARVRSVNPALNAIVLLLEEEALASADDADAKRRRGEVLGPLHGVPVTTKINVDQAGLPTDGGVREFRDLVAHEDAAVIANLRRAGAIVIGRTNTPAFSMRGHTDNALHGATLNPWDSSLTPGGSSGGAGSATAAGMGTIAHGNDIGGSIRWPAYCNGVIGLRPSIGRVVRVNSTAAPGRPMSSQLMAVDGPLARTIRDVRVAFEAMSASAPSDNRWVPVPTRLSPRDRPVKVALVTRSEGISVQPYVWDCVRTAGRYLEAAGYHVEEISPPDLHETSELWHAIGVTEQVHLLGPRVRACSDPGIITFLEHWWELKPPRDFKGYMHAFVERDILLQRWFAFLEQYPIVVMPSAPQRPLPAGVDVEGREGARRMLDALYFQLILPVLGIPGLAVPLGFHDGAPLGVQLVGQRYREHMLLDAGEVIEAFEGVRKPIDPRP